VRFAHFFARRILFRSPKAFSRLVVVLAVGSIALGGTVMTLALSTVNGFEQAIKAKIAGFVSDIRISTFLPDNDDSIRVTLKPETQQGLRLLAPEIQSLEPFIEQAALLKSPQGMEGVLLKGVAGTVGLDFFREALLHGELPNWGADTTAFYHVAVSQTLASRLQVKLGDKLRLYFLESEDNVRVRPAVVKAVYDTGLSDFDRNYVLCSVALLQRMRRWPAEAYQGYEVRLEPSAVTRADAVAGALNDALPYDMRARALSEQYSEVFDWLDLQHRNVFFILILMTLVAVINMATAIVILITERTQTIGLLRAIGASAWQIHRIFLWNAFYLILFGVVLGNVLGLSLLLIQDLTGWVKMDAESYYVETVPVAWAWGSFAVLNLGVVLVCTLFMVLPTFVVNRITPSRSLRFS